MKYYSFYIIFFCSFLVSSAKPQEQQYTVREYYNGLAIAFLNDKYGFIDRNKNVIIPIKYDYIEKFQENYAVVRLAGKYGYINRKGKEVIPLQYRHADSFQEGRARVWINDSIGFIDKQGKFIVPAQYHRASSFENGFAIIWEGYKYGFVNKRGEKITLVKYDYAFDFSDGLAAVQLNGKWGFINTKGKEVIALEYDGIYGSFNNGRATVYMRSNNKNIPILIDKKGRVIPTANYDAIEGFHEGLAFVGRDGKCGFIDQNGKEVIPLYLQYSNRIYRPIFTENENDTIPADYQVSSIGTWFSEGLAPVEYNRKWGFINKRGEIIIPFQYEEAGAFSEGFASVKLNGKEGFINKKGNIVIPCQYYCVFERFKNGYAEVWISPARCYLIDKQGNVVTKVERALISD